MVNKAVPVLWNVLLTSNSKWGCNVAKKNKTFCFHLLLSLRYFWVSLCCWSLSVCIYPRFFANEVLCRGYFLSYRFSAQTSCTHYKHCLFWPIHNGPCCKSDYRVDLERLVMPYSSVFCWHVVGWPKGCNLLLPWGFLFSSA